MSESEDINVAEDGTVRQEPPLETTPSIDPQPSINRTLLDINTNMGNMAALLQQLSSGPLPIGHRPFQHISTGIYPSTGQTTLPTGLTASSSTGLNPNNKRQLSDPDESEPPAKRNVTDDADESISIHADDDADSLVGDAHDLLAKTTKTKTNEQGAETQNTSDPIAAEFLDSLAKALETSDDLGTNINDKLAEIINKRWGKTLTPEKLKVILDKYKRPANCTSLYPIKVNKGAWEHLKYTKKQDDLRLANMQQVLRKVACIMSQTTDFLLAQASSSPNHEEFNKHISQSVDAFALLGHLTGNISSLRRSTMKPLLKPDYQALCSSLTEIPHGPYLFGDDLNKQLKEAEESNKVAKAFKGNFKPRFRQQPQSQDPSQQNNARRDFLWRGNQNQFRKKQPYQGSNRSQQKSGPNQQQQGKKF